MSHHVIESTSNGTEAGSGRLVTFAARELQCHPSLRRLSIGPSLEIQSRTAEQLQHNFDEPVTISQERYVLAGHARWEIARHRGEQLLDCVQLSLSGEEAVLWMIQKHKRSAVFSNFDRILLALELEPWFRSRAKNNQRLGGLRKGLSKLTEPEKWDVRKEVASAAGVSTGNVTKVKRLMSTAVPEIIAAVQAGEISIHRASGWLGTPEKQQAQLEAYRDIKSLLPRIHAILSAHTHAPNAYADLARIVSALGMLPLACKREVLVSEIDVRGKVLFVSRELMNALCRHSGSEL